MMPPEPSAPTPAYPPPQEPGFQPPPPAAPAAETTTSPPEAPPAAGVFQPNQGSGAEQASAVVHPGVTNASPTLTPGAQAAAARAHGWLSHIEEIVQLAKADIERYVPPEVLAVAKAEALAVLRTFI